MIRHHIILKVSGEHLLCNIRYYFRVIWDFRLCNKFLVRVPEFNTQYSITLFTSVIDSCHCLPCFPPLHLSVSVYVDRTHNLHHCVQTARDPALVWGHWYETCKCAGAYFTPCFTWPVCLLWAITFSVTCIIFTTTDWIRCPLFFIIFLLHLSLKPFPPLLHDLSPLCSLFNLCPPSLCLCFFWPSSPDYLVSAGECYWDHGVHKWEDSDHD